MTPSRGAAPWISVPAPNPRARLRLICFPYAGAGASFYFTWAKALAPRGVEVCAAQLPGRENRIGEPPLVSLAAVVASLGAALRPLLDRPFCLFGHSMGALIAFELARTLRDAGGPLPARLFVSGCRAPHVPRDEAPLHTLPDPDFALAVARRYQGMPKGVLGNPELLELVLPALRADMMMIEGYEYREAPPLDTGISAFGGDADRHVAEPLLRAWQRHTRGGFSCTLFPGDHFYLADARERVLGTISPHLDRQD